MMVVVVRAVRDRATEFIESLLQDITHLSHLLLGLVKGNDDVGVAFFRHDLTPLVEFTDMTAVMINPVLQYNPQFFRIIHDSPFS